MPQTRPMAYLLLTYFSRRTCGTGNPNMVDTMFVALKNAGLPVPHVRREKYVSSK